MDANAQRCVLTKVHVLEERLQEVLHRLPAPEQSAGEGNKLHMYSMCEHMVLGFMKAFPDWTWWALRDVLPKLKTSNPDRSTVLLHLFLRVIAAMQRPEDTLLGTIPRLLPPGFPRALERELAELLRELRQPYRQPQFFARCPAAWTTNQVAISYLQQQLLGVAASVPELAIDHKEALAGLEELALDTAAADEAWADFVAALLGKRKVHATHFAAEWPGAETDDERRVLREFVLSGGGVF